MHILELSNHPARTTHANYVCAGPGVGAPLQWRGTDSATGRKPSSPLRRGGTKCRGGYCAPGILICGGDDCTAAGQNWCDFAHIAAIITNTRKNFFIDIIPLPVSKPPFSARGGIKKSQISGNFAKKEMPNANGGLFSAFVCVYFTPDSGTLSTAFLPFFIHRL